MSSHLKAELAATCSTLGHNHKGNYLIEPECFQSVKDLIHYLKRDNDMHDIRRYMGESKVLQNDLIQIIKNCPKGNSDLFGATLRLLINLTTPTILFYGEDVPSEKIDRKVYLSLVGYLQDYKTSFCDVEFWNKICGKLTDLFEIDWAERSADDGIQIERILMLLRNVLQVPADLESEKRPENDLTVHDKILWTLRQSQILELLLFISSDRNEEQYFLNLLEIFSIILREQNPKLLANCDVQRSVDEKKSDTKDLIKVRESEKGSRNKYTNMRNFNATFVLKGVKSLSNRDIVCHKSLEKVGELDLNSLEKKQIRARRTRIPVESDRMERRSTFFVRLFLKEFCLEFLNCSFKHLMHVVKNKLDSGKTLANDQTYYFWALKFFLDFATASNSDVDLVKDLLSSESFHFVQTNMDNAFEHLIADKKKTVSWVKRIHLILKAYRSLLETLMWMDCSSSALTRSLSRAIKCQLFYVVEYREMTLHLLLRYDSTKFSLSFLRDLIETTHLFIKLLEEYSKQVKLVVQRATKKKFSKKKKNHVESEETCPPDKWEKLKDDLYDTLCSETAFPEVSPFDATLEIPIDDQKGRAMKGVQEFLHEGKIKDAIGLLRSARLVWPENDYFGFEGMSPEDEMMALKEICLADLKHIEGENFKKLTRPPEEEENESENEADSDCRTHIMEQEFDIVDYKKRLVNKKIIEGCGILLRNYKRNSNHTNHCVIKLLHRIGWECCMPAMLFQASIFWTLLKILNDSSGNYNEINTFTINLLRKFRKHATKNPVVFLELLFWKEHSVALEIQHGYEPYRAMPKAPSGSKKRKSKGKFTRNGYNCPEEKRREEDWVEQDLTEKDINGQKEYIENGIHAVKNKRKGKGRETKERIEKILGRSQSITPVFLGGDVDVNSDVDTDRREANSEKLSIFDEEDANNSEAQSEVTQTEMSQDSVKNAETSNCEGDAGSKICSRSRKAFDGHEENSKTSKVMETECNNSRNSKRASSCSGFLCSSGSEDEMTHSNGLKNHEILETTREDIIQREGIGQFEKRRRLLKKERRRASSEESDNRENSRPKRFRFIGSDSDPENFESGDGEPIFTGKRTGKRKRFTVFDTDSDTG